MAVTVATFGVWHRWKLPKALTDQLWLAHRLREDLVETTLVQQAALKAFWSSHPAIAATEAAIDAAEQAATEAAAELRDAKVAQRTKTPEAAEAKAALKTARDQARELKARRRELIQEARTAGADQITAIYQATRQARRDLYATYCQDGIDGQLLYWGTFHDVVTHHEAAEKRLQQARVAGGHAQIRHRSFDGCGTVTVGIRRTATQPPRTPAAVADPAGRHRNVFQIGWIDPAEWDNLPRAEQRQAGRLVARMRVGGGRDGEILEIPVQAHRMLPADAEIVSARLTVRRYGAHRRATIYVTARLADPEPVTEGPKVVVHFGWRTTPAGIEVAKWAGDGPIEIPDQLQGFMQPDDLDGYWGRIVLPAHVVDQLHRNADLRSSRDQALNDLKTILAAWIDEHPPVEDPTSRIDETTGTRPTLTSAGITQWRSPRRFARLTAAWETPARRPAQVDDDLVEALVTWRNWDNRQWTIQSRTASKAAGHRDDLYQQAAYTLVSQASLIVVDDMDLAGLARHANPDVPTPVKETASLARKTAAPGTLRAAITSAANRDGVTIKPADTATRTRQCHLCGHVNPAGPQWFTANITCEGCDVTWDQDTNALYNLAASEGINLTRAAYNKTKPGPSN
jgi:hypothetical protein